jgi:hypothetical protein
MSSALTGAGAAATAAIAKRERRGGAERRRGAVMCGTSRGAWRGLVGLADRWPTILKVILNIETQGRSERTGVQRTDRASRLT